MTATTFPEPRELSFEQARRLSIPDGLTPEGEYRWLVFDQRVFPEIATAVVHERHPAWWPPSGIDFHERPT